MTTIATPGASGMPAPAATPPHPRQPLPTTSAAVTGNDAADHVQVRLQRLWLFSQPLGTAPEAARSSSITAPERQAVLDIDRGARALGLVGAGQPTLTVNVRDTLAAAFGPYASGQKVGVPKTNVIAAAATSSMPGKHVVGTATLYPFDVALHELGHVVQSQAMANAGMQALDARTHLSFDNLTGRVLVGSHAAAGSDAAQAAADRKAQEASGLREGLSDATAAVVTHDWVLGEDYFGPGSEVRAVRDVSRPTARDVMNPIETDYRHARAGLDGTGPATREVDGVKVLDNEGHSIGGIVSRAAYEFQQREGWTATTQLVATLQRDPELWRQGGTLEAFRDRFLAAAAPIDAEHPGALDAARESLRKVGYDVAPDAVGSGPRPPKVPVPSDPGPQQPGDVDHHGKGIAGTAGTMALSSGVGAVAGAILGVGLAVFSPLNLKHGIVAGAALGASLGATRGYWSSR